MQRFTILCGCALVANLIGSATRADDTSTGQNWTAFRNGGTSHTSGNLPLTWSPEQGILWQCELDGYGQSTPVISAGRVFVASVIGPMKQTGCVNCRDLKTGTPYWTHEFATATQAPSNYMHSRAAPTPVVDDNGVYVFFEGGDLLALSHEGSQRWHRNLADDLGPFESNHGLGSSPAQTENLILLTLEHQGPSCLLAVDKATGQTRWKAERPSGSSWSSPIVVESARGSVVLVSSAGSVTAYQATSGEILWQVEGLEGNSVPSPTAHGDQVIIGARLPEFGESSAAAKSNLCLRITADGYDVAWQAAKVLSDYASPVVAGDGVYFLNKAGVLTCLDLATGERHFIRRLGCTCWATPLVAGNHVYFFGKNGQTHVIAAGPQFRQVAVNQLWDPEHPPKPEAYLEAQGHEHHSGSAGQSDHAHSSRNDSNGDPTSSPQAAESALQPGGFVGRLMASDQNEDGVLAMDELPEKFQRMAARGDQNGDGQLDQAELKTMEESFRQRRAGSREGARDPIVYGVAAASDVIVIRTGTRLYAVAASEPTRRTTNTQESQQP